MGVGIDGLHRDGDAMPVSWADEGRDDELRRLVDEGLSAGEIAIAFGVTRNAVIGRVHRLGVKLQGTRTDGGRKAAVSLTGRRIKVHKKSKSLPRAKQIKRPPANPCGLMDLRMESCRFIVTEGAREIGWENVRFCNAAAVNQGPYCEAHCKVAYNR